MGVGVLLLSLSAFGQVDCSTGKCSRNGVNLSPRGEIKVLIIFAEVTDPSYAIDESVIWGQWAWPPGEMPIMASNLFDTSCTDPNNFQTHLSKYYRDASLGELCVTGDVFPYCVSVSGSANTSTYRTQVFDTINNWATSGSEPFDSVMLNGTPLSAFDQWSLSPKGELKDNTPDGVIDCIAIVFRNNYKYGNSTSRYHLGGYAFGGSVVRSGFKGYQTSIIGDWNSSSMIENFIELFQAEFFHPLFGGNAAHSGSGAGYHNFITRVGNYGMSAQFQVPSFIVSGFDRWFLEYRGKDQNGNPLRDFILSATDPNDVNSEIETDITIVNQPNEATYILRDFVTIGDAIRIKLPNLGWDINGVRDQYLWLENHQQISEFDINKLFDQQLHPSLCSDQEGIWKKGLHAYIQVGEDQKYGDSIYYEAPDYRNGQASHLFPLPADGRHDFYYNYQDAITGANGCGGGIPNIPYGEKFPNGVKYPNVFTGNTDLYSPLDSDQDGEFLGQSEAYKAYVLKYDDAPNVPSSSMHGQYRIKGDAEDVYTQSGRKIDISSNPSPFSIYTHISAYSLDGNRVLHSRDNRIIWLSGLSIEIVDTDYYNDGTNAYEIKVRWDENEIKNDVRWCGNIVLQNIQEDPLSRQAKVVVKSWNELLLDQGKSITYVKEEVVPGYKDFEGFTEPTVMRVTDGAKLEVEPFAKVIIRDGSTLVIDDGAELHIHNGGEVIIESGGNICIADSAILNFDQYTGIKDMREIDPNFGYSVLYPQDVFPVSTGLHTANYFLQKFKVFKSITCDGPGLTTSTGQFGTGRAYSTGFRARDKVLLLPGFDVSAEYVEVDQFTIDLEEYQECDDIFEPIYTEIPYNPQDEYVLGGDHHHHDHDHGVPQWIEKPPKPDFGVKPNPTTGTVTISSGSAGDVIVFNAVGQVIYRLQLEETSFRVINLSGNPPGIYFIRFDNDVYTEVQRVVLQ